MYVCGYVTLCVYVCTCVHACVCACVVCVKVWVYVYVFVCVTIFYGLTNVCYNASLLSIASGIDSMRSEDYINYYLQDTIPWVLGFSDL